MHYEVLVEGQTERSALEPLLTKILGDYGKPHTWAIHKHRGAGELPADPGEPPDPKNPTLLHNLPSKLRAYGKALTADSAVVVITDLDNRLDCRHFKRQLESLLEHCHPPPRTLFRIAIEETEAWFLGDQLAIKRAYPNANLEMLDSYVQDSQVGTWELLAEAVFPGGMKSLSRLGKQECLKNKRFWARDIAPRMDIDNNRSPSFQCFRDGIRSLADL